MWAIDTGDSATTSALANLDGDSELEITIYNYTIGQVRSYNYGNATPFIDVAIGAWSPQYDPNPIVSESWPCSPGLADITNDGVIDIVTHNGVTLYCINGATQAVQWSYPGTHLFGSPSIADLDQDGYLEVCVTGKPDNGDARTKIEVVEHTGALKSRWWEDVSGSGFPDPSLNEACLADVDGDTALEIAAVDYSCYLVVLDFDYPPTEIEETPEPERRISILTPLFSNEVEFLVPKAEWVEYVMYDVCGRVVYEGKKAGGVEGKIRINVSEIKAGVYFLKVRTSKEEQTFKAVKAL